MSLASDLLKMAQTKKPKALVEAENPLRRRRTNRGGIPKGIYRRQCGSWHCRARGRTGNFMEYINLGNYWTLREAIEVLAKYHGCDPMQLEGISQEVWDSVKNETPVGHGTYFKSEDRIIPLDELRTLIEYRNGRFYWTQNRGRARAGAPVGWYEARCNHQRVRIKGEYYMLSRMTWYFFSGEWPKYQIVRVNPNADESIENLKHMVPGATQYGRDLVK